MIVMQLFCNKTINRFENSFSFGLTMNNEVENTVPELYNMWVVEFAEMPDVSLFLFSHFLHGNYFVPQLSTENSTLSSGTQPLQITNHLKRNFPVIYKNKNKSQLIQSVILLNLCICKRYV